MSVLEARYRRLLRLLPRGYRDAREEELVDTYLAVMCDADPDNFDLTLKHGRPSGAEMRAVVALALRARWGETVAPERFAARSAGLRIAVLMLLTTLWTIAVADTCWWAWSLAFPEVYLDAGTGFDPWSALFGPPVGSWAWIQQWSMVAWLPTLPLVVFGGRAGARWAAAWAALPVFADVANVIRHATEPGNLGAGYLIVVLISVATVAGLLALAAAKPVSTAARPVRYLVAGSAAVLALNVPSALYYLGAASLVIWPSLFAFLLTDEPAQWCWAAVIAALWVLARRLRHGTISTASLLALSVFAGAAALYRFLASVQYLPGLDVGLGALWTAAVVTQFALSTTICIVSGVMTARRLHRMPARLYPA